MTEARPYASLSSGLLARKGSAKPAMRPQGYGGFDDLGWNDMGYGTAAAQGFDADLPEHVPSSIAALTPAPRAGRYDDGDESCEDEVGAFEALTDEAGDEAADAHDEAHDEAPEGVEPSVVAQQRAILERYDGEEEADAAVPAPAPAPEPPARAAKAKVVPLRKRSVAAAGRKAAFTLRLDADRHLRLRLACAVTGRSAQQIVVGALDEALAGIPEIEALAARVPAAGAKRN